MMEGTDDDPGRKSFEQQGAQRELVDVSIELHWLVGSKIGVSGKFEHLEPHLCWSYNYEKKKKRKKRL
jgi:hypothetical protein